MKRLFILPFDHRSTFATKLLGFEYPLKTKVQKNKIIEMKKIVFDGFLLAHNQYNHSENMGILVDEEFGEAIIKKAQKQMIPFAMSIEKSSQLFFQFEHGNDFGKHIESKRPTYAKALVRYDINQKAGNKIQNKRLKRLSDYCDKHDQKWMIEPLMTGKGDQFKQMKKAISEIRRCKINPTLWKLEGLEYQKQWKEIRKIAKGDLIVLGRGETKKHVQTWITVAAKSGVVNGFAIGRTIFFKPLEEYRDKKITKQQAIEKIAKNYLYFIKLWEKHEA